MWSCWQWVWDQAISQESFPLVSAVTVYLQLRAVRDAACDINRTVSRNWPSIHHIRCLETGLCRSNRYTGLMLCCAMLTTSNTHCIWSATIEVNNLFTVVIIIQIQILKLLYQLRWFYRPNCLAITMSGEKWLWLRHLKSVVQEQHSSNTVWSCLINPNNNNSSGFHTISFWT